MRQKDLMPIRKAMEEVCRAHFVRTVTFRRLRPLNELTGISKFRPHSTAGVAFRSRRNGLREACQQNEMLVSERSPNAVAAGSGRRFPMPFSVENAFGRQGSGMKRTAPDRSGAA